jgi:tRNA G37 N-methylase Trm5
MGVTKVHDDYRTNELSLIPGGKTVTVTYDNGAKFIYDKVKNPGKYIKSISEKEDAKGLIVRIEVDGKEVWTSLSRTNPWDI